MDSNSRTLRASARAAAQAHFQKAALTIGSDLEKVSMFGRSLQLIDSSTCDVGSAPIDDGKVAISVYRALHSLQFHFVSPRHRRSADSSQAGLGFKMLRWWLVACRLGFVAP